MADIERIAAAASDGLARSIRRLGTLAASIIAITGAIGLATFATGWWVFNGSPTWLVIGGVLCLIPVAAAGLAWLVVLRTVRLAPRLFGDVRTYLATPNSAAGVLIDHDSGVALGAQAKSFSTLRSDLAARRRELPSLYLGVRAITTVPGLAAVAVLGLLAIGSLGTVLLIAGLVN